MTNKLHYHEVLFYRLKWPVKQELMRLFGWKTVEEAAQEFDFLPQDYLPYILTTPPIWEGDILYYEGDIFMSRYKGKTHDLTQSADRLSSNTLD